jgi:predicted phosphoribosyltransferase/dienelactone hydrolase
MEFSDRRQAGRVLARQLAPLKLDRPVVVALPRGGVPVAYEIARALAAPLDILAVRKIGSPRNPEFGVGAIAEDGTAVLDARTARGEGMTQEQLDEVVGREVRELSRRVERYRDGRPPLDVGGRTVVMVDDGLATGLTDLVGVRALRARGAARIVVAVPVCSPQAVRVLEGEADDVQCVAVPQQLFGVAHWYEDFAPVADAEVTSLLSRAVPDADASQDGSGRPITLSAGDAILRGDLTVPPDARGIVLFAHGSGSSHRSPRNRAVARSLNGAGFATLLFDLLSEAEARRPSYVFDVSLLAGRLAAATDWVTTDPATRSLPIGYFGASTGAGAALRAAAARADVVRAVVSRGGRPDLAGAALGEVRAPTLLIVGSRDTDVLALNRRAAAMLDCPHRVAVVEGAAHLFEEPGALDAVTELATEWFAAHLPVPAPPLETTRG